MPRTNDVYALLAGTKGVTLQTIQSGKYNAFLDDFVADANAPRPIIAGGTGASSPDQAAANLGLVSAKDMAGVNTIGGTANAVTIATDRDYPEYEDTLFLTFKADADIVGGGMTIDLDGLGAKPVYKVVAAGLVDVNIGDIIEGGYYHLTFDTEADGGDGAFILLNAGGASSAFQVGDFFETTRTLNGDWLRRNGALYDRADYPELADLLPVLEDGLSFETANTGTINSISGIAQGGGKYVAAGSGGWVGISTDRLTWSPRDSTTTDGFYGLDYTGGLFMGGTGGGKVMSSADGETWAGVSISTLQIVYKIVNDDTNYILVGQNLSAEGRIAYSADNSGWTLVSAPSNIIFRSIAANTTRVVIVGASGAIATSDDHGLTWTARTSGTVNSLIDVHWDTTRALFVAVGTSGIILTSTDGISWSIRTSGTSGNFTRVSSNSSGLIAVGSNLVRISTNGTTWTTVLATGTFLSVLGDTVDPAHYLISGGGGYIADATRTAPTQFRVPNDNPSYGWIKAVS